jgi:glycosyltransferase involved in cell wall biosynthesis
LLSNRTRVAAIAATLVRLLSNAAYRQMLAERGSQRAEQFSWEKAARQTLKIYRQAAEAREP